MASRLLARTLVAAAAVLGGIGGAGVAPARAADAPAAPGAQGPTDAERETARTLMAEGRARAERQDLKGALEAFKAADDLMHFPTTGLKVASAQVSLGMLVEARATLARVVRTARRPGEPPVFESARKEADELNAKLEGRVPALRISVSGATGEVVVKVDDVKINPAVLKFPYRLNPGHHVLVATATAAQGTSEVDVSEAETKDVAIVLLPVAPGASAEPAPAPAPAPAPETKGTSPLASLPLIGFSVAGAGVVVGTVTGILMLSKKSAVSDACTVDKRCPTSANGDLDSAYTMATVSTISFVLAGVGAGVGVAGLLWGRPHAPQPAAARARPVVEPWMGPTSAGVRGTF